jgi:CRP-like cAMP-binding protein
MANDESPGTATNGSPITRFEPGEILIRENELSRKMYVIRSGTVRVYKTYMNRKIVLASLSKGETFGEFSFFDSQPRSATVETVTEVDAFVIDADIAKSQIHQLPEWVLPLLKSVFSRFREADQKLTVLQSLYEFEKKHFKNDTIGTVIYEELLRFSNTLKLLVERDTLANTPLTHENLISEMKQVLGQRHISLDAFLRLLGDHEILTKVKDGPRAVLNLDLKKLFHLTQYFEKQLRTGKLLFINHSALAVLRRVAGELRPNASGALPPGPIHFTIQSLKLMDMPLLDEALKDLQQMNIVELRDAGIMFEPDVVLDALFCQSFVKNFDHTTMQVEW